MPYVHFSDSQKQRAAAVDLEAFLLSRGERLLREGRDKRLASDHSVTVCGNEWYDHAVKEGGGPISFVQKFYGLSYPEAMTCRPRMIPCAGCTPIYSSSAISAGTCWTPLSTPG